MIQEKINKLIPYISENFISYPLWEEGNYIPVISFWAILKDDLTAAVNNTDWMYEGIKNKGYELLHGNTGYEYTISPIWDYCDGGDSDVFKVENENWSIEEMIDIITEFLIENKILHE